MPQRDGLSVFLAPIGGADGSGEMALNVIAERVLGLPRESSVHRGLALKQVRHNRQ